MKEATGELNMTVVTVVAIAALIAFFYLVIWPVLNSGIAINNACNNSNAGTNVYSQDIKNGGKVECDGNGNCSYTNADGDVTTKACES